MAELWRITETLRAAHQAADRLYLDRDDGEAQMAAGARQPERITRTGRA